MGAARDAYEVALGYALHRKQFGRPIASFRLTQAKLVGMALEIQKGVLVALLHRPAQGRRDAAARADLLRQAEQRARGHRHLPGGPYRARRQRRDAAVLAGPARQNLESVRTYEGTDEIHTLIMGRAITGLQAFEG